MNKYRAIFERYFNKVVTIRFGSHSFEALLKDVRKARLVDMKNVPEKRSDGDRFYTPAVLMLEFDAGSLHIVMEDIEKVALTTNSIYVIMISGERIEITCL